MSCATRSVSESATTERALAAAGARYQRLEWLTSVMERFFRGFGDTVHAQNAIHSTGCALIATGRDVSSALADVRYCIRTGAVAAGKQLEGDEAELLMRAVSGHLQSRDVAGAHVDARRLTERVRSTVP